LWITIAVDSRLELKRQIARLHYERSGLSRNKKEMQKFIEEKIKNAEIGK
jgi:predicted nuclease of restriction endonuclease-like (RecB) superfamily